MTWVFFFTTLLFLVLLCLSVRRNFQLEDKLEELGDQVNESLDVLDGCYGRIAQKAEIPVMSDEPVIRELLSDMRMARDAVLLVANKLVVFDDEDDETRKE